MPSDSRWWCVHDGGVDVRGSIYGPWPVCAACGGGVEDLAAPLLKLLEPPKTFGTRRGRARKN